MIWSPQPVERRQQTEVAFQVGEVLYSYLYRTALHTPLPDDPPWPVEFGDPPTFSDMQIWFGYESVAEGDWLVGILGSRQFKVINSVLFDRAYKKVDPHG